MKLVVIFLAGCLCLTKANPIQVREMTQSTLVDMINLEPSDPFAIIENSVDLSHYPTTPPLFPHLISGSIIDAREFLQGLPLEFNEGEFAYFSIDHNLLITRLEPANQKLLVCLTESTGGDPHRIIQSILSISKNESLEKRYSINTRSGVELSFENDEISFEVLPNLGDLGDDICQASYNITYGKAQIKSASFFLVNQPQTIAESTVADTAYTMQLEFRIKEISSIPNHNGISYEELAKMIEKSL